MEIGYVALRKLNVSNKSKWQQVVRSPLRNRLTEIISLDSTLCPSIIQTPIEEDKGHRTHEFLAHDIFSDLPYLTMRVKGESNIEIVAVLPNPSLIDIKGFEDPDFEFLGYELIDIETRIDPLLNCSTFDNLLPVESLTVSGLISDFDQARKIQKELADKFPDHVHADTVLFAIWRKK